MRRAFQKVKVAAAAFLASEEGSLKDLVWVVGAAVLMVIVVMILMGLTNQTVPQIWNSFVGYMRGQFGF